MITFITLIVVGLLSYINKSNDASIGWLFTAIIIDALIQVGLLTHILTNQGAF